MAAAEQFLWEPSLRGDVLVVAVSWRPLPQVTAPCHPSKLDVVPLPSPGAVRPAWTWCLQEQMPCWRAQGITPEAPAPCFFFLLGLITQSHFHVDLEKGRCVYEWTVCKSLRTNIVTCFFRLLKSKTNPGFEEEGVGSPVGLAEQNTVSLLIYPFKGRGCPLPALDFQTVA